MPHALTDHETIRRWAEARGMEPALCEACADRTPERAIRLRFAGAPGSASVRAISWHEWFRTFDRHGLVLVIESARRQPSPRHAIVPQPPRGVSPRLP